MAKGMVETNGGSLFTFVEGSGPALIFIHAGIATADMWRTQAEQFRDRYTVVRYDTRGFGRSKSQPVTYSDREDLLAVLDAAGVTRAVLIGCSRGGQIALDFALEHPERVVGLVTVCGGLSGYQPLETDYSPEHLALFDRMEAVAEAGQLDLLNELEIRLFVDGMGQPPYRVAPELRAWVLEMNAANLALEQTTTGVNSLPLDPPAVRRLSELAPPLLVMIGDLDTPGARGAAARLTAEVHGARQVVFHDVAHLPSLEQPDRFRQELTIFLKQIGW